MTPERKLEQQIEVVVKEYLHACRQIARSTIERALGGTAAAPKAKPVVAKDKSAKPAIKRSRAEIEGLQSKLYAAVAAQPGETMRVLAEGIGATPAELQVPVAKLKKQERIRTVGTRQFTRYFPTATTVDSAAMAA